MYKLKKYAQLLLLITILSLSGCKKKSSMSEIELHKNWSFKNSTDSVWDKATVPGTVHTDLLSNGTIDDPFYRLNEHHLQWIDKA